MGALVMGKTPRRLSSSFIAAAANVPMRTKASQASGKVGKHSSSRNNSWAQIVPLHGKVSPRRALVQLLLLVTIIGPVISLLYFLDSTVSAPQSGPCSLRDDVFDTGRNATHLEPNGCPPDPKATGADMDVVGLALKATCVNVRAILALNNFLSPRRIFIITSSQKHCHRWTRVASNVVCLDENRVIPSLTKSVVAEYLQKLHNEDGSSVHRGRDLSGWYFQQLLKLGVSRHIPDLSQHFLIWDLDMVMLKPMDFFEKPVTVNVPAPAPTNAARTEMQQVGGVGPQMTMQVRPVRVHIGGKINEHSYDIAYKRLFGKDLKYAHNGSSFVTHHMVVYRPYMEEFLDSIAAAHVGGDEKFSDAQRDHLWAVKIMESINEKRVELGFSEYQSYISFVLDRYPESMKVLSRKMWERNPIMYTTRAKMLAPFYPLRSLCCPSASQLTMMRWLGYEYVGIEMGHMDACKLHEDLTPAFLK